MRIYVAGPMTNVPYFNRPLFDEVSEWLRSRGHEVVNPCDQEWNDETDERFADPLGRPRRQRIDYLKYDLPLLMGCDAIVLLPNWCSSVGACAEKVVAEACDLAIGEWDGVRKTVWWTRLDERSVTRA